MNVLTKDTYEELKAYEHNLNQAYKGSYYMGLPDNKAVMLKEIYYKTGGNKVINIGCGNCVLTMLKELGSAYFKYKKEAESKPIDNKVEQLPANEEKVAEKPQKEAKKRTTKTTKTTKAKKGGE